MIKKPHNLRFQIFWKTALSMLVLFGTIMLIITTLTAQLIANRNDYQATAGVDNIGNQLYAELPDLLNSSKVPYGINSIYGIFNSYVDAKGEGTYLSAALLDADYRLIAVTGNMLTIQLDGSTPMQTILVKLDGTLTNTQIVELYRHWNNNTTNPGVIIGVMDGTFLIPTKIILTGDGNHFELDIANKTGSTKLVTYNSKDIYGYFETLTSHKTMTVATQRMYQKCHAQVDQVISKYKGSGSLGGGGGMVSLTYTYNTGVKPFLASDQKTYYVAYSYICYPMSLATGQLMPVYIIGLVAALIILLILSSRLARGIAGPIGSLTQAAVRMNADGEAIPFRLDKNRNDEIGVLAESLDSMSRKLHAAMEKLRQDAEHACKMEAQRRELTGAIAHELKTPLGIVHSYAEGLQEKIAEDKREHYLDVIMEETERINALVLEMLELSRLEANASPLKLQKGDLGALARSVLARFEKPLADKNIRVETDITDGLAVLMDAERMEQVVVNFLTNAIRHTPEGGTVTVSFQQADGKARFSIENEGEPIPQDQLPKIWDTFYKVDPSRSRSAGGSGLGLAISRNILKLHHAGFGAENTATGVRFRFDLDV